MARKKQVDTSRDIKNRIVGYGSKPASQFLAHPKNWRTHPQPQRDALAASLHEVGWVATVIENVQTGHLVDGHERVWQALQNNDAEVPYVQVDLAPEEEALILATLDPIGAMAEANADQVASLLAEIHTDESALQELLHKLAKDAEAIIPEDFPEYDENIPETKAEASAWVICPKCGHRFLASRERG